MSVSVPHPLRGPWRSSWGFLWLLCRALPRCYLRGDIAQEDLVLCSQPPHPMCSPLLHDPAGLPAPCQLWGEDQPWWGIVKELRRRTGVGNKRCICYKTKYISSCKFFTLSLGKDSLISLHFHYLTFHSQLSIGYTEYVCCQEGWDGGKQGQRKDKDRKGKREDERVKSNEFS